MSEEIEKIILDLEGCCGIFDYMLTPIENNLLVSYIKQLQQENQNLKEEVIALRKGLSKTRIRRDKYKRRYLKEKCNWNELKKWLEKCKEITYEKDLPSWLNFKCMSDKMQEIESGKNE